MSCLFLNYYHALIRGIFHSVTCFIPLNILFLRCIWDILHSEGHFSLPYNIPCVNSLLFVIPFSCPWTQGNFQRFTITYEAAMNISSQPDVQSFLWVQAYMWMPHMGDACAFPKGLHHCLRPIEGSPHSRSPGNSACCR